jgi:hypothetical protein
MEGDDVQAMRRLEKVELWVAWLDPAALLVSHNLDTALISINLGYLLDISRYWILEPFRRSRLSVVCFGTHKFYCN